MFSLKRFDHNMPKDNTWLELLTSRKLKEQLTELIKDYELKNYIAVLLRIVPFVITSKEQSYRISTDDRCH